MSTTRHENANAAALIERGGDGELNYLAISPDPLGAGVEESDARPRDVSPGA